VDRIGSLVFLRDIAKIRNSTTLPQMRRALLQLNVLEAGKVDDVSGRPRVRVSPSPLTEDSVVKVARFSDDKGCCGSALTESEGSDIFSRYERPVPGAPTVP